jgi:succinate-semialdehyde dehydrogenase / glutarate-semialdehyde dehydrogenase
VKHDHNFLGRVPGDLFIGGRWRPAENGNTLAVCDPATDELVKDVADASRADGLEALAAAEAAAGGWASTSLRERADLLQNVLAALQERAEEFTHLLTLETGKPLAEARAEVAYSGEFLRWFSEEAPRIQGRYGQNAANTGRMIITQHPVGPCLLITPWNFPLGMAARKIAPALAAGCTIVIKPPELAPLSTLLFASLFEDLGLPAGVLNVVTTSAAGPVCEPLLRDPRLRKLSFTGSTAVGIHLLEQAAPGVLRTSMELGGNAPFLVFEDADMDAVVEGAIAAKFRNVGQACTAANRFIVHHSVAEELAWRLAARVKDFTVGHGTDEGVDIGSLIDGRAVAKVERLVEDAVTRGAQVHVGGSPIEGPGNFFAPTVLSGLAPGSQILREEIFGPVLAITTFQDEDQAVRLANDTNDGLVSYVYTEDLRRAHRMIERLETGMMGLNVGVVSDAGAPFGGWKHSGLGREGGAEGIHEYLQTKYTLSASPFP